MLVSLISTHHIDTSARVALRYITYFFSGLVIINVLNKNNVEKILLNGTLAISLFWTFDALVQLFTGVNLLGYPKPNSGFRLTGMFYPNMHVGIVLTVLSPLLLEALRRLSSKHKWVWFAVLPITVVILFGGSRTSWLLMTISVISYFIYVYRAKYVFNWKAMSLGVLSILVFLAVLIQSVPWIKQRVYVLPGLLSGNEQIVNVALSNRLPIWKTSVDMFSKNWVSGVGPRAFRYAYDSYAREGDEWYQKNTGHPHLFILEVGAETGVIGIVGYLMFLFLIIRKVWQLSATSRSHIVPWGLAVVIAAFPLASAMAFYANFMSALIWVLTIIFISQLWTKD